jgi:hypothetical protein
MSEPGRQPGDQTVPMAPVVPVAERAEPVEPPQPVRHTRGPSEVALGAVLLAVLVGLAFVGQDHWRRGLLLVGAGLLVGAVVRLVLPARLAGLLVVRGRVFDAVVLAVLGGAVIALTTSVPLPSASG